MESFASAGSILSSLKVSATCQAAVEGRAAKQYGSIGCGDK